MTTSIITVDVNSNALDTINDLFKTEAGRAHATAIATLATKAYSRNLETTKALAAELSAAKADKSYIDEGCKSVADCYSRLGLSKTQIYDLAAYGDVQADKTIPESIKAMPPSNVAALKSALSQPHTKDYIIKNADEISAMNQGEIKSLVKDLKTSTILTDGTLVKKAEEPPALCSCQIFVPYDWTDKILLSTDGVPVVSAKEAHGFIKAFGDFIGDTEDVLQPLDMWKESFPVYPAGKLEDGKKKLNRYIIELPDKTLAYCVFKEQSDDAISRVKFMTLHSRRADYKEVADKLHNTISIAEMSFPDGNYPAALQEEIKRLTDYLALNDQYKVDD